MSIGDPKTRAEAEAKLYGRYKKQYDPTKCAAEVASGDRFPAYYQCTKKPGKGPDRLYCGTHCPEAAERRNKERLAKYASESAQRERDFTDQRVGSALRKSDPALYRKLAGKGEA